MITPLNVSAMATFGPVLADGTSRAVAFLGPQIYGTKWNVKRMNTTAHTTNASVDVFLNVYRNVEAPTTQVDSTYSGIGDVSDTDMDVIAGENLMFVWTAQSDPGSGSTSAIVLDGIVENSRR